MIEDDKCSEKINWIRVRGLGSSMEQWHVAVLKANVLDISLKLGG